MIKTICLGAFFMISYSSNAQFRDTKWGFSKNQVKSIEKADYVEGNNSILAFKGYVGLVNVEIAYFFSNDQLTSGMYLWNPNQESKKLLSEFFELEKSLTKKYGKPIKEKEFWYNDLLKSQPEKYSSAIAGGHLKYVYEWETKDTKIQLIILGNRNIKAEIQLGYYDKKVLANNQISSENL